MWLAVFDYQHERDRVEDRNYQNQAGKLGRIEKHLNKEYDREKGDAELFMRNPNLYRIGMNNECFGN